MNMELANKSVKHNILLGLETGLKMPEIIYDNLDSVDRAEWNVYDSFAVRKIQGSPFTVSSLYEYGEFKNNTIIITDNFLLNGSRGTELPSNIALMFSNRENLCMKNMKKLVMKTGIDAEYKGYININVKRSNGELFFNGVGFGLMNQYDDMRGRIEETRDNFAVSLLLFEYPFDFSREAHYIVETGNKINKAWEKAYSKIDSLPENICFRTDGLEITRNIFNKLRDDSLF